jgi:hypothetical protein
LQEEAAGLKTKAMREAEERAKEEVCGGEGRGR